MLGCIELGISGSTSSLLRVLGLDVVHACVLVRMCGGGCLLHVLCHFLYVSISSGSVMHIQGWECRKHCGPTPAASCCACAVVSPSDRYCLLAALILAAVAMLASSPLVLLHVPVCCLMYCTRVAAVVHHVCFAVCERVSQAWLFVTAQHDKGRRHS